MGYISRFRGLAGEASNSCLRSSAILSVIFLSIVLEIFTSIFSNLLSKSSIAVPVSVIHFIFLVFPSIWVAHFALPSREGALDDGYFNRYIKSGRVSSFAMRYTFLTCIWFIPVSIAFWLISGQAPMNPIAAIFSQSMGAVRSFTGLLHALIYLLLCLAYIIFPMSCYILATYTDSVEETMSAEPWLWLFKDRREDLKPFMVSVFGTIVSFFFLFLIPGVVVFYVLFKLGVAISNNPFKPLYYISQWISLIFFSFFLIVIGRLSGVFVFGDEEIEEHAKETEQDSLLQGEQSNSEFKMSAKELHSKIEQYTDSVLDKEILAIEEMVRQSPKSLIPNIKLAFLNLKVGKIEQALEIAAKVLQITLTLQRKADALYMYQVFSSYRENLVLTSKLWKNLSEVCLELDNFIDSAWCLYYASTIEDSSDQLEIQKKLLSIAHQAKEKGSHDQASTIYRFFLKKFPDTSFKDFVTQQL